MLDNCTVCLLCSFLRVIQCRAGLTNQLHTTNASSHLDYRRGGQWLTCRTHASLHGYGNVSVSVSIDRAHLQRDLRFEYVEDPTITKIEPEWSIYRYGARVQLQKKISIQNQIVYCL